MTAFVGWLKTGFNAGTLLAIFTIAAGLAVTHGKDEQRIDDLEHRVVATETGSVHHSEYDAREKALAATLASIDARLANIERVLMGRK